MSGEEAVFYALARAARAAVLERYEASSCVLTTAVLIDLAADFKLPLVPLVVRAILGNPAFFDLVAAQGMPNKPTMDAWVRDHGAWCVGLGYSEKTGQGRLNGHLVAMLNRRVLIDASLDQADRPQRDLRVGGPIVATMSRAMVLRSEPLVVPLARGMVSYTLHERQDGYQHGEGWQRSAGYRTRVTRRARELYRELRLRGHDG